MAGADPAVNTPRPRVGVQGSNHAILLLSRLVILDSSCLFYFA